MISLNIRDIGGAMRIDPTSVRFQAIKHPGTFQQATALRQTYGDDSPRWKLFQSQQGFEAIQLLTKIPHDPWKQVFKSTDGSSYAFSGSHAEALTRLIEADTEWQRLQQEIKAATEDLRRCKSNKAGFQAAYQHLEILTTQKQTQEAKIVAAYLRQHICEVEEVSLSEASRQNLKVFPSSWERLANWFMLRVQAS